MGHGRPRDEHVSKVLSHALRHAPWLYELELDDEGWASLDAVLAALRAEHESWQGLLRADLERVVAGGAKRRHEIAGDRIRALYGHSLRLLP
jgi:putative RNA 2'-phosphotransferase